MSLQHQFHQSRKELNKNNQSKAPRKKRRSKQVNEKRSLLRREKAEEKSSRGAKIKQEESKEIKRKYKSLDFDLLLWPDFPQINPRESFEQFGSWSWSITCNTSPSLHWWWCLWLFTISFESLILQENKPEPQIWKKNQKGLRKKNWIWPKMREEEKGMVWGKGMLVWPREGKVVMGWQSIYKSWFLKRHGGRSVARKERACQRSEVAKAGGLY